MLRTKGSGASLQANARKHRAGHVNECELPLRRCLRAVSGRTSHHALGDEASGRRATKFSRSVATMKMEVLLW